MCQGWISRQGYQPSNKCRNSPKSQLQIEIYTEIAYIWDGTVSDLIELSIAIHRAELIRKPTGELLSYAELVRILQQIFGLKIPNIYSRKTRTMERKKNVSPLLERMLALYRHEVDRMYSQ